MQRSLENWLPLEKAANALNCKSESILNMATNGLLRYLSDGDLLLINKNDLEDVIKTQGGLKLSKEEMRRKILFLEQRVARLQESVDLLLQVNNIAASTLIHMTDDELLVLHTKIRDDLNLDEWDVKRLLSCAEIYMRIGEPEIDRINGMIEEPHSWKLLLQLCLKQINYVTKHPEFPTEIMLQRCRDLLWLGRNNLRSIATVMIEINGYPKAATEILVRTATADIESFDILVKQLRDTCPRGQLAINRRLRKTAKNQ